MKQLLLIDDDAAFLATYQRALQRRGHQVHTASCGREALAACLADAGRPAPLDGIVLDLRLGQENGLQLIDQIRQWQPSIPLLLLTGYASIATAVEAIKRGASDYRPKPIGADELLAALFPPDPDAALPTAAPAIAAEVAAVRGVSTADGSPGDPPALAGSLLYVDGSAFEAALMAAALQDHPDFELRTAEGEDDCVAQARARPPSLILLDVDRPELDSARLLRRLREHDQTHAIPVVALSSSAAVDAPPPGAQPAFAGHLVKPFDLAVLEATLRRAIGSP